MKKKIIILIIITLLLGSGGIFWWQKDQIEMFLERRKLEKIVAPYKDYKVVEENGERFIINKKDGFKAKIPHDWEISIRDTLYTLDPFEDVTLFSKDFNFRPPQGCLIEIQITRLKERKVEEYNGRVIYLFEAADEVREKINDYKNTPLEEQEKIKERDIKIILVDQKEAIQEETNISKIGKQITIRIPTENRVYIFRITHFSERCDEELKQFLETVSIK